MDAPREDLHGTARDVQAGGARLRRPGSGAAHRGVGAGGRDPQVHLAAHGRAGLHRRRVRRKVRGRRRGLPDHRRPLRGDGALALRVARHGGGRADGHVLAPPLLDGKRGAQGEVPAGDLPGGRALRHRRHRAGRGLRRRGDQDARRPRRRALRAERLEDVHHQRRARRPLLRRRADRHGRRRQAASGDLDVPRGAADAGLQRQPQARQDGQPRVGHRRAGLPGHAGPGGEPPRASRGRASTR